MRDLQTATPSELQEEVEAMALRTPTSTASPPEEDEGLPENGMPHDDVDEEEGTGGMEDDNEHDHDNEP